MINQANWRPEHATCLSTCPVDTIRPRIHFLNMPLASLYTYSADMQTGSFITGFLLRFKVSYIETLRSVGYWRDFCGSRIMIFLEHFYRPLLMVHLLASFVLVGMAAHNLIRVFGYMRGRFERQSAERTFTLVSMWLYAAVFAIGALIYPTFRVRIRADYFDKVLPWAKALFEIKEHAAAIGLALVIAACLLRRNFEPSAEREKLWLYVPLWILINIVLWYQVICGPYLVMLRSIQ
jgi:hypothetical protein